MHIMRPQRVAIYTFSGETRKKAKSADLKLISLRRNKKKGKIGGFEISNFAPHPAIVYDIKKNKKI